MFEKPDHHRDVENQNHSEKNGFNGGFHANGTETLTAPAQAEEPPRSEPSDPNADQMRKILAFAAQFAATGEAAAGVVHEMNNPLQIILGKLQISRFTGVTDELLTTIEDQAMRIANILRGLVTISTPNLHANQQFLDVNTILNSALKLVSCQLDKRRIKLNLDLSSELPAGWGDAVSFERILINFILLTKQTMNSGGDLAISTFASKERDFIIVQFCDSADTWHPDVVHGMRNPYGRLADGIVDDPFLGIYMSALMLEMMGGKISHEALAAGGNKIALKIPVSAHK